MLVSSASAFRKLPSIYVFSYFPFGFAGRMWDLIVSVPDHCLSFYLDFWLFQGCASVVVYFVIVVHFPSFAFDFRFV